MELDKLWKKYEEAPFNLTTLPQRLIDCGERITFRPGKVIVSRGDLVEYIYFIRSGKAIGTRDYADGNEYNYFQVDQSDGNIGVLEILAKKRKYVATIMSYTEVETIRIKSTIIYEHIMKNEAVLRQCIILVAQDLYRISGNDGILYYLSGIDRLRHYLVKYYEEYRQGNEKVVVNAQYQEISKTIGVSIRTVGRSIRQLKEQGEILSQNKKIILTEKIYQKLVEHCFTILGKND